MKPMTLDHIALYVPDRDKIAIELCDLLDVHVVDRTDRYTLVGASATSGKLTLFDPPSDAHPESGVPVSVLLADEATRRPLEIIPGLILTFGVHDRIIASTPRHSVIGLTLGASEPAAVAAQYRTHYGFEPHSSPDGSAAVALADSIIAFNPGSFAGAAQPMLNHLGLLVASAQQHINAATEKGLRITNVVDAPNTLAVFVDGPDGVTIEYVEHKPEFALA